jgi:hypothetical protein
MCGILISCVQVDFIRFARAVPPRIGGANIPATLSKTFPLNRFNGSRLPSGTLPTRNRRCVRPARYAECVH